MSRVSTSAFNSTSIAQCMGSGALAIGGLRLGAFRGSVQPRIGSTAVFFVTSGVSFLVHKSLGMIMDVADSLKNLEVTGVLTDKIPDILSELPQKVTETLQDLPSKVSETLQDLPLVPETLQDLQERIQEINLEDFDIRPVPPIAASISVYLFSFLVCLTLHRIVKRWMPEAVSQYALDFIKTLVVCCYPYAHNQVRKNHGHYGYCMAMVAMAMITQHFMPEGSPTPLTVWTQYLEGTISIHRAFIRMIVQVLGAMCSEHMVTLVWYLELHPAHTRQLKNKNKGCFTDLNVPAYLGFTIECLGAALDTWLCMQPLSHLPFVDNLMKCISGAVMTVAGLGWTGMYIQPAMATSFTLGCDGTSISTHIAIYWGGTFLGTYLGMVFNKYKRLDSPKVNAGTMTDLDPGLQPFPRSFSNGVAKQPAVEQCGSTTDEKDRGQERIPGGKETGPGDGEGMSSKGERGQGPTADLRADNVGQMLAMPAKLDQEQPAVRHRVTADIDCQTCPPSAVGV